MRTNQVLADAILDSVVSCGILSSTGELRGFISAVSSKDAGQAVATIPSSSGDDPVEI